MKKGLRKLCLKLQKNTGEHLMEEINADRVEHDKKPFDDDNNGGQTEETLRDVSTTDPESGVFHKVEHKRCFAYLAQMACEKHGYILDSMAVAGNVHDSVSFDSLYDKLMDIHKDEIEVIAAGAAYKMPWICKRIIDDGKIPAMPLQKTYG